MRWEPVTPPSAESETPFVPFDTTKLTQTITHGFHMFCFNDIHGIHLGMFLGLCVLILAVRWWTLGDWHIRQRKVK